MYVKQYQYLWNKSFHKHLSRSFWQSDHFKTLLITNLINLIHAPPHFEYQFITTTLHFQVRYSLSTILSNIVFLRFYLVIRLITNMSMWTNLESEESCEREGFQVNFIFAIKALTKERPYLSILINFTASVVSFGIAVRSFERYV